MHRSEMLRWLHDTPSPWDVLVIGGGIFTDTIRPMDDAPAAPLLKPSQGIHIVLDHAFLPGTDAIMVPHTAFGERLHPGPALPEGGNRLVGPIRDGQKPHRCTGAANAGADS